MRIPLLLRVAVLVVTYARFSSTFAHFCGNNGNHVQISSNQRARRDCGHFEPGISHIRTTHVGIQSDTIVTMILNASAYSAGSKIVVFRDHDPGDTVAGVVLIIP